MTAQQQQNISFNALLVNAVNTTVNAQGSKSI